jgi:hypothetical protein
VRARLFREFALAELRKSMAKPLRAADLRRAFVRKYNAKTSGPFTRRVLQGLVREGLLACHKTRYMNVIFS